jgi:hypothetical protein
MIYSCIHSIYCIQIFELYHSADRSHKEMVLNCTTLLTGATKRWCFVSLADLLDGADVEMDADMAE